MFIVDVVCSIVKEWSQHATIEIIGSHGKGTALRNHNEVDIAVVMKCRQDSNFLCDTASNLFEFLRLKHLDVTVHENWICLKMGGGVVDIVVISDQWEGLESVPIEQLEILRLSASVAQRDLIKGLPDSTKNVILNLKQWKKTTDWGSDNPPSSYLLEILVFYSKSQTVKEVVQWVEHLPENPTIFDPCDSTNNLCATINWKRFVERFKRIVSFINE